ncbi:MAG: DUF4405 domain-containing protein [Phycisphaerales bacterium]|jgi:hypothetical protein|nr:DUF4405 domain-containing protein [Phycisphaerales bacterium]
MLKRNTLNFLLDVALALAMLGLLGTGLVMRFVLPPGSGRQRLLWGWGRHDWGDLHYWLVLFFLLVLIVHLAMHWRWACVTTAKLFRRGSGATPKLKPLAGNLIGVAVLLVITGLSYGFVRFANQQTTATGHSTGSQVQSQTHEPNHDTRPRMGRHRNNPAP